MFFLEQVADRMGLFLPTMQVPTDRADHFCLAGRSAFAERIGLDVLVKQFVRIQLGTVTGQADQSQAARVVRHELLDGNGSMYRMSVDDQIDLARGLLEQALHELDEGRILDA